MKKRIATLLMATMVATMMTACGGSSGGSDSSSGTTSSGSTGGSDKSQIEFPLASPMSYDFHYHARDKYVFDPSWPVFVEMEKLTNISFVNKGNVVATNSTEQIQLQATDQFPYDLYGGNNTGPYYMQYGPLGAFYNLDDYKEYMPNFYAFLADYPQVKASITAEDGEMYHIPYIQDGGTARTFHIRQDWLDNLGLEMPTTVAEYEEVLRAFKTQDANGNGNANDEIPYFNDKWYEMIRLVNLFDARCYAMDTYAERVIPNDDGTVYHAWMADEFKDAISELARWYKEGLIDQEIFTKGSSSRKEYLPGDVGGSTHEWVASTSSYNDSVTDVEGFNLVSFAPPITANGNQWEEHERLLVKPDGWAISSNCSDPEELFMYMDYFYSEEGRILSNFGVEGEHWEYVDGQATFLPGILDGSLTGGAAVNAYLEEEVGAQLKHGYWMDYQYESQWTNAIGQEGVAMYDANASEWNVNQMPSLSYTDAERKVYDSLLTPLNDKQDEWVQKWISGTADVNATWDQYISECQSLQVDNLMANYESALARFLEASGGVL